MKPELKAFVIVNCTSHAVAALTVLAAWMLDSGAFLLVALLIVLLGGYSYETPKPTVCPKCGNVIKAEEDEEAC